MLRNYEIPKLINDLLNFSRLSKAEDDFQTVDLNKLPDSVLSDFDLLITQRNAVIDVSALPILVGSPVSLRQLFYNLISNALKFGRQDVPPHIKIKSRKATKKDIPDSMMEGGNRKYQLIEISDNGIGFEQKYAEKIFEVFQRLNTRGAYSGSGIGLSIVKRIIENHNGHISAASELDKGTTFTLLLPLPG